MRFRNSYYKFNVISLIHLLFAQLACMPGAHKSAGLSAAETSSGIGKIRIDGPFHSLIYERDENIFNYDKKEFEAPYHDVQVTYGAQTFTASIRLRGGIRFCTSFPQLKLKVPKSNLIDGQREFKIITHGTFELDPNVPVYAPACPRFTTYDQREYHRLENRYYDLSNKLLDFHLKTTKFDVQYVDTVHGIDVSERAYFVEDKAAAGKRYQMEPYALSGLNSFMAWRGHDDEEEFIDYILRDEALNYLSEQYLALQKAHPEWTKSEISASMEKFSDLAASEKRHELQARAEARRESVKESIKSQQLELLQSFDLDSLSQTVLFNTMLQNSDWNVLGVNPTHSTSIKNVELLKNSANTVYTVPYDFNESGWIYDRDQIASLEEYKTKLESFAEDQRRNMNAFLLPAMKQQVPIFIARLDQLRFSSEYDAVEKARFANFSEALKEFVGNL